VVNLEVVNVEGVDMQAGYREGGVTDAETLVIVYIVIVSMRRDEYNKVYRELSVERDESCRE